MEIAPGICKADVIPVMQERKRGGQEARNPPIKSHVYIYSNMFRQTEIR